MGSETQEQTLHVDKEQYINWTGERMRCSDTSKCARVCDEVEGLCLRSLKCAQRSSLSIKKEN